MGHLIKEIGSYTLNTKGHALYTDRTQLHNVVQLGWSSAIGKQQADALTFWLACLVATLMQELEKVPRIAETTGALMAYTHRHLSRMDRLLRSSYLLDYTLDRLNVLSPLKMVCMPGCVLCTIMGMFGIYLSGRLCLFATSTARLLSPIDHERCRDSTAPMHDLGFLNIMIF